MNLRIPTRVAPLATCDPRAAIPGRLLVAAGLFVAAARWWTSRGRTVFHITPDEPGQLAIARYLGGWAPWNMFDRSTWRPGFGMLLTPIHWFTSDPVVAYRAVLAVNALLGGVACVLLCLLARRLTDLSARAAVAAAVVVALSPAVLFTTNWAWAESLVSVVFLATLLAMLRFQDRPTLARGLAVGALAVASLTTHSRLLPMMVVAAGLVAVAVVGRRLSPRDGLVIALSTGVLLVVSVRWSSFLVDRLWEDPRPTNTVAGVIGNATKFADIVVSAGGQIWYQLVTTAGLAGLGAIAVVRSVRRSPDARIVAVAAGSLVVLSVVFMADRTRPDHLVYGRYNDAVMGPVVVIGLGVLLTSAAARTVARSYAGVLVGAVVTAGVLVVAHSDLLDGDAGMPSMMLGLQPFIGGGARIEPVDITVSALAITGVVAAAAFAARALDRRRMVALALMPLLAVGYSRTAETLDANLNGWALPESAARSLDDALPPGSSVAIRIVTERDVPGVRWADQRLRSMLYQFYLPHHPMRPYGDGRERFVFAPLRDATMADAGGVVVWRDPFVRIGLWELP